MFYQREQDWLRRQAVSDNRGGLRKALHQLRHINRQMNEELRARKAKYEKTMKDNEMAEWKEGINMAATLGLPPKMKSNLSQTWPVSPASMSRSMSAGHWQCLVQCLHTCVRPWHPYID